MGVKEVDQAFMSMIDMSAELLQIGKPETAFSLLKQPEIIEVKSSVDFELIDTVHADDCRLYEDEYLPLLTELKRFEPDSLLFSSLEPGQGVSFTAGNIARIWAADTQIKVLLLELYNGTSGSSYNNPADKEAAGISDNLLMENYLVQLEDENVFVYSVRAAAVKDGFDEFWQILKNSFDMIIIDAAPQGYNIMTEKLSGLATGAIMITSRKPDPILVQSFEQNTKNSSGRFLGVVMNAME